MIDSIKASIHNLLQITRWYFCNIINTTDTPNHNIASPIAHRLITSEHIMSDNIETHHLSEIKFEMIVDLLVSHNGEQLFHCFWLCFTYILMPHNMIILYFRLLYYHVSNSAQFLHSTFVLSFYIDVVLTHICLVTLWLLNQWPDRTT